MDAYICTILSYTSTYTLHSAKQRSWEQLALVHVNFLFSFLLIHFQFYILLFSPWLWP